MVIHMSNTDNQRIAKNTIFLYFRMLLTMFVSLYTSRVTLQVLGVDDFGIYQTVGGVVTFLAFLSNALGSGTSRFITYEMGKEKPQLDTLFSTVKIAHIVLGLFVVVIGEIIGLWFIENKLMIPNNRMSAAIFAFHFSMFASFFQITQIPYNATIIAYERMNVYAYVSIAEALLKLGIVYILQVMNIDKLQLYAVLTCVATVLIMFIYRMYCKIHIKNINGRFRFDKKMFSEVAVFSGWYLFTSSAASFANQGVTIVTNMFFSPAVVTVRSLALRVNNIINQFVGSFRTAVNPQIVKKYAAENFEESKKLALESTRYTYYLMLALIMPLFFLTSQALTIWLGKAPEGLVLFVKLALIQGIFQTLDTSLYVPIYAKGQIKENAIISPLFDFLQLPIVYFLFSLGAPAVALAWVETAACIILGIVIKPVLLKKIVQYNMKEVYKTIMYCFVITATSAVAPGIFSNILNVSSVVGFLTEGVITELSILLCVWFWGLDQYMRSYICKLIKSKIKNRG